MTKQRINRVIAKFGLEIVGNRSDGYYYFLDTTTQDQIGESVYVCYLNQLTLDRWVAEAETRRRERP